MMYPCRPHLADRKKNNKEWIRPLRRLCWLNYGTGDIDIDIGPDSDADTDSVDVNASSSFASGLHITGVCSVVKYNS